MWGIVKGSSSRLSVCIKRRYIKWVFLHHLRVTSLFHDSNIMDEIHSCVWWVLKITVTSSPLRMPPLPKRSLHPETGRNGFSAARFSVPGFPFMFFLYTVFHFAVFPVAWFSLHRFYLFHQAFYHLLIRLFSIMQFGGRGNCLREIELFAWVQGFSLEL